MNSDKNFINDSLHDLLGISQALTVDYVYAICI
jgi:hypothetical protein